MCYTYVMEKSIESLFGSKTRVKLLDLFMNNPDKQFYVREITRLIDEQVNSVRRELSNLQNINVVKSATKDRKLFYSVNQRFKYYVPLRAMFAGSKIIENVSNSHQTHITAPIWQSELSDIEKLIDVFVVSGVLLDDSDSNIDMLLVGDNSSGAISDWASKIEKNMGRELNYTILSMSDFYYRYSTGDTFLLQIFNKKHKVVIDKEELIREKK